MPSRTIGIALLVAAALIVGGCKRPTSAKAAGGRSDGANAEDHDRPHEGPRHKLGTKRSAGYVISVTQIGDTVKPHKTATFEIKITPQQPKQASPSPLTMPRTVRAWIGNERADGVPKVLAPWRPKQKYYDADLLTGRLPAESRLWIELETDIEKHYIPFDIKEK